MHKVTYYTKDITSLPQGAKITLSAKDIFKQILTIANEVKNYEESKKALSILGPIIGSMTKAEYEAHRGETIKNLTSAFADYDYEDIDNYDADADCLKRIHSLCLSYPDQVIDAIIEVDKHGLSIFHGAA